MSMWLIGFFYIDQYLVYKERQSFAVGFSSDRYSEKLRRVVNVQCMCCWSFDLHFLWQLCRTGLYRSQYGSSWKCVSTSAWHCIGKRHLFIFSSFWCFFLLCNCKIITWINFLGIINKIFFGEYFFYKCNLYRVLDFNSMFICLMCLHLSIIIQIKRACEMCIVKTAATISIVNYIYRCFMLICRYDTQWYHVPLREQKLMLFVLHRSMHSCKLITGGTFVLSLEGFTSVNNDHCDILTHFFLIITK